MWELTVRRIERRPPLNRSQLTVHPEDRGLADLEVQIARARLDRPVLPLTGRELVSLVKDDEVVRFEPRLVLSFALISSSVRRFPNTPWVYVSGISVSSPGIPIGIFVQSPSHMAFCSRVNVQVSVEITDTSP